MPEVSAVQPFIDTFPPDAGVRVPDADFITYGEGQLPSALIGLWRAHGLGWYGGGRVALVDPGTWMPVLQTWFGSSVTSTPFAVTSFGHIYHYDRVGGRDRIQCLDPHFQHNAVVAEDGADFFTGHLTGSTSHLSDLRELHKAAREAQGELGQDEIYYFEPILALGGQVNLDNLQKGNGPEHVSDIHRQIAARQPH
ncbi:hypothetical protein GCM10011492_03160 [Flexivirga endophytica]|uniref:DUF1851 domain-containing protein n=1 Tax=Flexivirga endophytica TaxID=1849103 RepID=A0A916SU24_9MICO|nr:T6SS immunity protein Tdi1 domain-containing protein [Flexivirga endophytica]GGB16740.1 hypothetical protein GCM10011492_03160 [Flexivirga endophytica]GHB38799.1 hypothetical protein GCM10008112_04450 [Flexivirga endophytica]